MIYDVIIIGAGASGLFAAATMEPAQSDKPDFNAESEGGDGAAASGFGSKRLILEKTGRPGTKLLMSGSGQCNITHDGSIKDFINCYGSNGKKLRSILYKYNNLSLMDFLEQNGLPTFTREDGKVFPLSMNSHDVLSLLMDKAKENGFAIKYDSSVTGIGPAELGSIKKYIDVDGDTTETVQKIADSEIPIEISPLWLLHIEFPENTGNTGNTDNIVDIKDTCTANTGDTLPHRRTYLTRSLIIATGGCSYPTTGSDGAFFSVLQRDLGIQITPLHPALSPIQVTDYPYGNLAGISFENAHVTILPEIPATSSGQKNQDSNQPSAKYRSKNGKAYSAHGGLLFTHNDFSGPSVLNCSKYASAGDTLRINYLYPLTYEQVLERLKTATHGSRGTMSNIVAAEFGLPKRFCQLICDKSGNALKNLAGQLTGEVFSISSISGFDKAMVTGGGIALSQINTSTMEFKSFPGLYAIGEALDVDGITGGYNLQFAYSSGRAAAAAVSAAVSTRVATASASPAR